MRFVEKDIKEWKALFLKKILTFIIIIIIIIIIIVIIIITKQESVS